MQILKFLALGYIQKWPKVGKIHETETAFANSKRGYEGTWKFYKVFVNLTSYIIIFKLTLGYPWATNKDSPMGAKDPTLEYNR